MEALTGFNFHRGVLALVRRPSDVAVDTVIRDAIAATGSTDADRRPRSGIADRGSRTGTIGDREDGAQDPAPGTRHPAVLVVAEHLVDVDNVGSCFRNARAFGAACVLLDDRCPDPLYRKAVRTSLGAVLEVPWAQAPIGDLLEGSPLPAWSPLADARGRRRDARRRRRRNSRADAPVALVMGNEGHGLTPETQAGCTHLARIPMAEGADSLNVATALAVALYEWRGRRR